MITFRLELAFLSGGIYIEVKGVIYIEVKGVICIKVGGGICIRILWLFFQHFYSRTGRFKGPWRFQDSIFQEFCYDEVWTEKWMKTAWLLLGAEGDRGSFWTWSKRNGAWPKQNQVFETSELQDFKLKPCESSMNEFINSFTLVYHNSATSYLKMT